MVYKFFDKKGSGSGVEAEPNYQLSNELSRQIIRKFEIRKVFSSFRDNICGVYLADMQLIAYHVQLLCELIYSVINNGLLFEQQKKNEYRYCISKNNLKRWQSRVRRKTHTK